MVRAVRAGLVAGAVCGLGLIPGVAGAATASGHKAASRKAPSASGKALTVKSIEMDWYGYTRLQVQTPGKGRVQVLETAWSDNLASAAALEPAKGRFVFARASQSASRATTLKFTIAPSAEGRELLARPRYPVTVRVWVEFTPAGKGPQQEIGLTGIHPGS